jgi:hypothetical protein
MKMKKAPVWNIAWNTYHFSPLLSPCLVPKEPHPYDVLHEAHVHSHVHGSYSHDHSHPHPFAQPEPETGTQQRVSDSDMDKLRSTLKQFVRDWSAEVKAMSQTLFPAF